MHAIAGLEFAFDEISLVLFTTLAPSGAAAIALMMLFVAGHAVSGEALRKLNLFTCIPLVTAMVGLVASATHLGNPSNALYVFTGVGRSPLSTEVFWAVVFLGLTGLYWLYSFAERPREKLQRVWALFIVAAAVAFVTAMASAYHADTIVSWRGPYVPVSLWLNALVGGPLLALLSFRAAGFSSEGRMVGRLLFLAAIVALAMNVVVYVMQASDLAQVGNSVATMTERVPFYLLCVVAFVVLAGAGVLLVGYSVLRRVDVSIPRAVTACVLALLGIFVMRFVFYATHLTVGISM